MEKSCGILAYRWRDGELQVLLGRNGGPFGRSMPWNIPKGHVEDGESEFQCAVREFGEETGLGFPDGKECIDLGSSKTGSGRKTVVVFGLEHDYNPDGDEVPIVSTMFTKEYPRHSGKFITAPELERARYIPAVEAVDAILPYQRVFVERLMGLAEGGK